MATMASRLLRAAGDASLASRAAAANASRAAAMAARSARAAAAAAAAITARLGSGIIAPCPTRGDASTKPRNAPRRSYEYFSNADYEDLPDDAKSPTDKDVESDEAVWALYERWCKAFNKERDHAEMVRRFKIFRYFAKHAHHWNTHLPSDPEEAAIYLQKREEVKLLISKGKDVSNYEEWYLPMKLGPFADGGDPFITERSKRLLKSLEVMDPFSVVEDVKAE